MKDDDLYEVMMEDIPEYGCQRDRFWMKGSPEAKNRPEEEDYGYSAVHPLYFRNYQTADRFLSLITKESWEETSYRWERGDYDPYGAVVSEVHFFTGEKELEILHVCCYGVENASVHPKGFVFKEPWGPDFFVDDPSLVQCRYTYPEGNDLRTIAFPWEEQTGFYIGKDYSRPIALDGNLSPELQHDWQYMSDFLSEKAKEIKPSDCPLKSVYIDCICDSRYYRIYPSFIHAEDTVFEYMADEICDILRELGCPYYCYKGMLD